jgi:hypothetical protein
MKIEDSTQFSFLRFSQDLNYYDKYSKDIYLQHRVFLHLAFDEQYYQWINIDDIDVDIEYLTYVDSFGVELLLDRNIELEYMKIGNHLYLEMYIDSNSLLCSRLRVKIKTNTKEYFSNEMVFDYLDNIEDDTTLVTFRHKEDFYNALTLGNATTWQQIRLPIYFLHDYTTVKAEEYSDTYRLENRYNVGREKRLFFEKWHVTLNQSNYKALAVALDMDLVYFDGVRYIPKPFEYEQDKKLHGFTFSEIDAQRRPDDILGNISFSFPIKLRAKTFAPTYGSTNDFATKLTLVFNQNITLKTGTIKIENLTTNTSNTYNQSQLGINIAGDMVDILEGFYIDGNYKITISAGLFESQDQFSSNDLINDWTFTISNPNVCTAPIINSLTEDVNHNLVINYTLPSYFTTAYTPYIEVATDSNFINVIYYKVGFAYVNPEVILDSLINSINQRLYVRIKHNSPPCIGWSAWSNIEFIDYVGNIDGGYNGEVANLVPDSQSNPNNAGICNFGNSLTKTVYLQGGLIQANSIIYLDSFNLTVATGYRWARFNRGNTTYIWDVNPTTGELIGVSTSFNC